MAATLDAFGPEISDLYLLRGKAQMNCYLNQRIQLVTVLVLLGTFAGCASIDFDYPREESFVMENTGETFWATRISPLTANRPEGEAGFDPVSDGIDALAARLVLAKHAERSIDVQYYLIKNDLVGRVFVHALLQAADRGVRVRLLLDDVFTSGYDAGMLALDSHPNFEIRIFNPFNRGAAGRTLGALADFGRINRRMHNKSFTIDNEVTIIGGRNIADEYFGAREDAKFGDLDTIGIGPVVDDVSEMFDIYWNHTTALPVGAFAKKLDNTEERLVNLRESLVQATDAARNSRYAEAVVGRAAERFEISDDHFSWATYSLVYDDPDKGVRHKAMEAGTVLTPLLEALAGASREVEIISPYFVPRKTGIDAIAAIKQRGIDVTVITNSLAANNQFTVHSGYAPSRKPLLRLGVKLYEVRPDATVSGTEYVDSDEARATLHTKAFIVDRERTFIGSFNFDPRSANINTEMGVIIDDPGMAEFFSMQVEQHLPTEAYSVFLDDKGRVRWRGNEQGQEVIYSKEPQTTWWQRFKVSLVRILPIRGQL